MINIAFADWWNDFDISNNFITRALDNSVEYKIVSDAQEADFVFCSVWKRDCFKYTCPRILFTGENYVPDFNIYDYAIGFDFIQFGDRYIRYPLYLACYEDACTKIEKNNIDIEGACDREFCSFVVSNDKYSASYREDLFDALSSYKTVASGGRYRNNVGLPGGVEDKEKFASGYKFNIACENSSHSGYCTEKIVEAFAAGTIPVYWGDPDVGKYFNTKAFVNCNDFASIEEVVEYVKVLDNNDDLYLEMLKQPKLVEGENSFNNLRESFAKWLIRIVNQEKSSAYRRSFFGHVEVIERNYITLIELEKKQEIQNNKEMSMLKTIVKRLVERL